MRRWLVREPKLSIGVAEGKTFPSTDIVIINFDILHNFEKSLSFYWDLVVIDEAHYLVTGKTRRAKAVFGYKPTRNDIKKLMDERGCDEDKAASILRKSPMNARRKLAMTGTPMVNRVKDLFGILNWLDPVTWDNGFTFLKRYAAGHKDNFGHWNFSGASHAKELSDRLRSGLMLRRLKKDVWRDMPSKLRKIVEIPNTLESVAAIKAESEKFEIFREQLEGMMLAAELAKVSENKNDYKNAVKALTDGVKLAFDEMATVRKQTAISKLPAVIAGLKELFDDDPTHKIVLFGHHREVLLTLQAEFPQAAMIIGGIAAEEKNRQVEKFQNEPACNLFLGGLRAAAEGITLTASAHVIFIEEDWTPSRMTQAEDRCLTGDSLVWYLRSGSMGLATIKDIKPGDFVLSHTGKLQRVTDNYSHEHRGMFTRICYMGWSEPITCTHDHKFFIRRDGQNKWIQAHQLLPSDSMAFPKQKDWNELKSVQIKDDWRIYKTVERPKSCHCGKQIYARQLCYDHYRKLLTLKDRPKLAPQINSRYVRLPDVIKIDDEWLYLFGWYAAEGFTSLIEGKSKFVSFSAHEKERHILERIAKKLLTIGVKSTIYKNAKTKGIEMRSYSGELAFWFRDWFGRWSSGISLPKEIQDLPPHQASVFLRGYTDGDGYQRKRQVEWVTASQTLCYQMCLLAIRAGFIPTMRRGSIASGNHWIGGYTKFGNVNRRNSEQDSDYIYRPIRSVETFNDKIMVYDLTVENDHSFTTGFASAHNCHRIGQHDNVLVEHWVLANSIDMNIVLANIAKQELMDSILDDGVKNEVGEVPVIPSNLKLLTGAKRIEQAKETATFDAILKASATLTAGQSQAIAEGLHMLADQCAEDLESFDSKLISELLRRPLNAKQAVLGRKLCLKYQKHFLPENLAAIQGATK